MSNNNEKDDNLTVSGVHEILKSPIFLKHLYWDILSGIKEKKSYKFIREIAEGVLDQNMEVLDGLDSNIEADNDHKKKIIAEISVMSYTIDKVFSKILYMKLEKACKEQVVKIIQELKDEGKIPENVWSKFKMNTDITDAQTSTTENKFVKTELVHQKREFSNENIPSQDASSSSKTLTEDNLSILSKSIENNASLLPKEKVHTFSQDDSDVESEYPFGCASPVSSVHTSDLSSFDDEIILSSDDEKGEKKTMHLKEALKKYSENDRSKFSTAKKTDIKLSKSFKPKVSMNNAAEVKSELQEASFESPSENGLPKRTRKPNSRYSSGNMLCPAVKVKERKKSFSSLKTYGNMSSDDFSPQNKKVRVDDDIYDDVVAITQSINEGKSNNNEKTPPKQAKTPDLFKPHSANRSLTSRRTAPVTLFST